MTAGRSRSDVVDPPQTPLERAVVEDLRRSKKKSRRAVRTTTDPQPWLIEKLAVTPPTRFRQERAKLLALLEADGASLREVGQRVGIDDPAQLDRLPVVSAQIAREYLEISRNRFYAFTRDPDYPVGVFVSRQWLFSVAELVAFKLTPRPFYKKRNNPPD